MTKNHDKIVDCDISKRNLDMIFFPYRPPLTSTGPSPLSLADGSRSHPVLHYSWSLSMRKPIQQHKPHLIHMPNPSRPLCFSAVYSLFDPALSCSLLFFLTPSAGSDDAVPPHFNTDILGSRELEDNIITTKHKEGIYSKRANMKRGKMHISVSISIGTIFAEF